MRRRSFTLVEIMVVLIIIAVVVTIFMVPAYQASLEASRQKVCATNEQTLKAALDIYAMENDQMPGSLSEIPPRYLRRAYAQVMRGTNGFLTRFAQAFIDLDETGKAYAQVFMLNRLAKGDVRLITCPSDTTPPPGGISYGLNQGLRGKTAHYYKALPPGAVVIMDCDSAEFDTVTTKRYRHGISLNYITVNGNVTQVKSSDSYGLATLNNGIGTVN